MKKYKNLFTEMVRTDFKLRYQGSILGYLWSLLKPLMLFAILYTVFTVILDFGRREPNYALSLLLGIVLWSFFTEATTTALKSVVSKGSLIRKISIPRHIIPITSLASAFINLLLNLIVVFIFVLFADNNALSLRTVFVFPLLLVELTVVAMAVGFFLATVFVRYRDIEHIWDVVKQALFYTIPIIYPLSRIPSVKIQQAILLNPLAQIIQDSRSVVTYERVVQTVDLPNTNLLWLITPYALVLISLFIGVGYFNKRAKHFAEDV
jgi:ABC-2 type transport system permease protein